MAEAVLKEGPVMSDLIERLRKFDHDFHVPAALLLEAANEIEHLNAEAAEMRRLSLELYTATTGPAVRRAQ